MGALLRVRDGFRMWHCWRASLLRSLSTLRYGWNLGTVSHQEMILEAQEMLDPKVIVMSPSFGTWTSSGLKDQLE